MLYPGLFHDGIGHVAFFNLSIYCHDYDAISKFSMRTVSNESCIGPV